MFLLDASGSMNEEWDGQKKFEASKKLLVHLIDSLENSGSNIEIGMRVFGHQFPKAMHNCQDSKFEISFQKRNAQQINSFLETVIPKGYTPIAYSLFQAINDFPEDLNAKNAIILITDGIENCDGDPCAIATLLQKKRIFLKPFIIGLGIQEGEKEAFDCVGTYYDAADNEGFKNALNVVISQTLNTTTVQVNLMDLYDNPTESNIEMTFYDSYSGDILYNFVHTFNAIGNPDTLFLNPAGKYDLTVHSLYPVTKKNIELTPGKHNIIDIDVPLGTLKLSLGKSSGPSNVQCIVREANSPHILYVQDMNLEQKYLVGDYDLEILTLPEITYRRVTIEQSKIRDIKIPVPGSLSISAVTPGIMSIYIIENDRLKLIYEMEELFERKIIRLQPGKYEIVFRRNKDKGSFFTEMKSVEILSGRFTNLRF